MVVRSPLREGSVVVSQVKAVALEGEVRRGGVSMVAFGSGLQYVCGWNPKCEGDAFPVFRPLTIIPGIKCITPDGL